MRLVRGQHRRLRFRAFRRFPRPRSSRRAGPATLRQAEKPDLPLCCSPPPPSASIIPLMTWDFSKELARHGPDARTPPLSRGDAWAYCARVARTHYENFSVASLLLPRRLLRHFHAVYAYCRWADDLADESGGGERALALLGWWRDQI